MYQTLLVPLDGSSRAEQILPHVEHIAAQFKSKVIFMQVLEPIQVVTPSLLHVSSAVTDAVKESLKNFSRRYRDITNYLTVCQTRFREKSIDARKFVEQGPVVETIISVAQRENVDLIAIASHGRTGLSRVFYGSVAAGLMQKIDRPILIVRSRTE